VVATLYCESEYMRYIAIVFIIPLTIFFVDTDRIPVLPENFGYPIPEFFFL